MLSAYFGFQKDPFSSTADPAFFVAHSSIKEAVGSLLFSQLSQRKGLTLITGEAGAGKTALLSNILDQDRANNCSVYLSCGEGWTFAILLERWSDELGIRDQVSVQEARVHAVIDFLSARAQQGHPISILLLDQAENLTDDALEGLTKFSKIESGGSALVQAILAARPEMATRLGDPKLEHVAKEIIFQVRLEPIEQADVGDYIRNRLDVAGYEGPDLFSDDAIETVADASRGIAAHVNLLCHTALQLAELEQEKSVTAAHAEQAIEVCTKYLRDRADSAGNEAGADSPQGTEQESPVGEPVIVDLALKKRSRTTDEIWPMQIAGDQLDAGQLAARQPEARQPETKKPGTGQLHFAQPEAGTVESGPVVLAEVWPPLDTQSADPGDRPRASGLWPLAVFVAIALATGGGIAWYRLPSDNIARDWSDVGEQLALRQIQTDADSGGTPAGSPAGETLVSRQDQSDLASIEPQVEPQVEPRVEPPASPPIQTAQVLKAPRLAITAAEGYEDQAIPLAITLLDVQQTVTPRPSLTLSGLPSGTVLSAGRQEADGTWNLEADDLPGLTLATPANYSGSFKGDVTVRLGDSGDGGGIASEPLAVTVASVADTPFLEAADVTGKEDQPIALELRAELADLDGSERLTVQLEGLPDGVALSAGRDEGGGIWTLPRDRLEDLQLTPPKDFSGSLQITTRATAQERGNRDKATAMAPLTVTVLGVADPPHLEIEDVSGEEDQPVTLTLDASLADRDNSEELEILLSGLPEGTRLTGGELLRDGSWKVGAAQLSNLTLLPPKDLGGIFPMTIEAISRERDNGDEAITTAKRTVSIQSVTDRPTVSARDASGREDTPIPLDVTAALADRDGSEDLAIMLTASPKEARFSAGTENTGGAWVLRPEQLPGLRLFPPADFSGTVEVAVEAFAREKDGQETANATSQFSVAVAEVADPPYLAVRDAEGQAEQPVPLHVMARLSDLDGSENLVISLAGLPKGSRLSAGEARAGGDWILTAEELPGLRLLPPATLDGSFQVTAQATTWESGGDKASLSAPFEVFIAAAPETIEVLEESVEHKIEAIYLPAPDLSGPDPAAPIVAESDNAAPQTKLLEGDMTKRGDRLLALGDVVSAAAFL